MSDAESNSGTVVPQEKDESLVRILAAIVILLSVVLAVSNSLLNPLFEPPDELQHYQFVRDLIKERRLPIQSLDEPLSQAHQPPLYYLVGALLTSPVPDTGQPARNRHWTSYAAGQVHRDNKNQFLPDDDFSFPYQGTALAVHILRLWSVSLLAGTLLVVWQLGKDLWPAEPWKRLLLLAIMAMSPMLIYIGSSVNNDNLVIFLGALALLLTARALKNGFSWTTTVLMGVVCGLAILTKLTGLFLLAPCSAGLLWYGVKHRSWRLLLSRGAVIAVIALALSGWWFWRNYQLYGEPTGLELMLDIWGERPASEYGQIPIADTASYLWTIFWGRFGYGQIVLPRVIYWLFAVLVLAALGGLILSLRRARSQDWLRSAGGMWFVFGVVCVVYLLGLIYYILRSPTGANSRYMFPALPAFAAILVAGLSTLYRSRRTNITLIALLAVVAVFSVGLFVPWTYAAPRKISVQAAMEQFGQANELIWANGMRLLGAKVEPASLTTGPGSELSVTACWQAEDRPERNYIFFVHLLDPQMDSLGQRDMHPGLGNYPTSIWQTGDVFCDRFRVPVVEGKVTTPQLALVEVGFYDAQTREQLQASAPDGRPIDFAVIDQIVVRPASPASLPEPEVRLESAGFAQGVTLSGYGITPVAIQPGQELVVRLWWQASGPLDSNYQVFAHLVDEAGQLVAQADGPPQDGAFPTAYWQAGDVIVDERRFSIPQDAPEGQTTLRFGLYRLEDGSRLARTGSAPQPDFVEVPGPFIGG